MSEIKNVCFAYITPFHPDRGGIGRVTYTLTLELMKRGYNVFYLIYPSAITVRHEYSYPAPLEFLPSGECVSEENINFYFDYLKRNKIDVVINQSGNFSDSRLWCKAREIGVKVISVLHSNPWISYLHLWDTNIVPLRSNSIKEHFKRIARIILYPKIKRCVKQSRIEQFQFLLSNTDRVCLLSQRYYKELSDIVGGYEKLYAAIPNPNTIGLSYKSQIKKKKQLLFVGLFSSQKKEDLVLKLWQRIYKDYPEWNLVIVGDGPKERVKRLKRMASKTERVTFTGLVPSKKYQEESSILLITSGYEGWSMVLTEAMQCGTVPMAFNSYAAVSEIINDGKDGFLIKPFDLDEYERKLRLIMTDENLRDEMAKNATGSVKRFDVKNVVDQWVNLFNSIK